jgi:restriction system protein
MEKPRKPTIFDFGLTQPEYEYNINLWEDKKEKYYSTESKLENKRYPINPETILISYLGIQFCLVIYFRLQENLWLLLLSIILIPFVFFAGYGVNNYFREKIKSKQEAIFSQYKKIIEYQKSLKQYEKEHLEYLIEIEKHKLDFWQKLSPYEFEAEVCILFSKNGFNAKLTKGSGDDGVDIIITSNSELIFVQCKKYSKEIGPAAARQLLGVMVANNTNKGILISFNGFSSGCEDFCRKTKILCINGPQLINFDKKVIEEYILKKI